MSSTGEEVMIGRSYTRARRSPLVIGKLPGAGRLPGGPYTITQVVTMVVGFLVLVTTRSIWAHFGFGDILIMIVGPWGLAFALRYARMDGRDPARALLGLFAYTTTPRVGRLAGRPVRPRRPQLVSGQITVHLLEPTSSPAPSAEAAQVPEPQRTPVAEQNPQPRRARLRPVAAGRTVVASRPPASAPPRVADRRRPAGLAPGGARSGVRSPAARTALQELLAEIGQD